MKLSKVKELLSAHVHCCEDLLDKEVEGFFASDMMSDVLAVNKSDSVLLSGLMNIQAVRTAEMLDMSCIVFVRGKQPADAMVEFASESNMLLMSTNLDMFESCGILYTYAKEEAEDGRI